MSLPATFDLNYYIGDTEEFVIYPTAADGSKYDLTNFAAVFVISNERSAAPAWSVNAEVTANATEGYLHCIIHPSVGLQLQANKSYYYDVEIRKGIGSDEAVYTLLRGTIKPIMGVNKSG